MNTSIKDKNGTICIDNGPPESRRWFTIEETEELLTPEGQKELLKIITAAKFVRDKNTKIKIALLEAELELLKELVR